jgi:tetratricopeptide (TPR) repeat protein
MSRRLSKERAAVPSGKTTASRSRTRSADVKTRWLIFGVCVLLAIITWVVFGQTVGFQFVNFDDADYVFKNPQVVRGLTIEGIAWAFTSFHAANWHPLTWLSHMLDCQLYGLSPGGHHLTNVLIHAATAILLFLVLRDMTGALWRSAFVVAVFAIHPLRVESVAWVAERKDVLSGLFFMLTLGAYVRYARRSWSLARYGLVVLLFALGLMCKPMLVTLPFVLLLLDYWPLNRVATLRDRGNSKFQSIRRLILEKLPLLLLVILSSVVTLFAQELAIQPLATVSIPARLGNALVSCVAYIRDLFWPSGLAASYPFAAREVVLSRVLPALALLICLSLAIFVLRRRYPYLVTGWLWYLVTLGPVIGILQVGNQARADRYTYLPQIGLVLLLAWLAADLSARWHYRRYFLGTLSATILIALVFAARTQASYWRNSESLWTRALACTSDNAIAEQDLGDALHEQGRMDEAMAHFQRALQINPDQASAHSALGLVLLETGRPDESVNHLLKALEINPNFADAHYNLGNTFMQIGSANEALIHFNRALEINPDDIEALNNMAWILATWSEARIRDGTKAVQLAERANSLTHGENPIIGATLAASYAEAGRAADAVRTAQRALQFATGQRNTARANSLRAQIELYQSGAAFRDRRHTRDTR